jgi:hypothetical protein
MMIKGTLCFPFGFRGMPRAAILAAITLGCSHAGEIDLGEVMEPPVLWDKSLNLRLGAGFKDNVLLSPAAPQASPFMASGLEAMLLRIALSGPQAWVFISGDDYRYLRDIGVDKEQTLVGLAKVQQPLGPAWELFLSLQYIYQDQVIDVSPTEAELTTVQLKGHSIKATPGFERKLGTAAKLQIEAPVHRQFLRAPLDDYWETGTKASLEREYGRRSAIFGSYAFDYRMYDDRLQAELTGQRIPGTRLRFFQHDFEAGNRHFWDEKRRWRSDTRLGYRLNLDNGPGFFDYHRYRLSQQFRYSDSVWLLRATGRANHYRYPRQTVAIQDPSRRHLTSLSFTLRAERTLIRKLKIFAEYEREDFFSNRPSNEYRANTVMAGIDWEL